MRYYLRDPEQNSITGPFDLNEIEAKLQAGELSAGTLATGDIGEGLARILHASPEDWLPVESIRGLGEERQPDKEVPPPPPTPLPLQIPPSPPRLPASGMTFCPACGHKLAPDAGNACDRCGKGLAAFGWQPIKPQGTTMEGLPSKIAVATGKVLWVLLQVLAGMTLVLFLLGLLLAAMCRR